MHGSGFRSKGYYAILMDLVRETGLSKLPATHLDKMLVAFYDMGKGISLEAEQQRMYVPMTPMIVVIVRISSAEGIRGTTGTMKWTLANRAQVWKVVSQNGSFAETAECPCKVMVSCVRI